MKKRLLVLPLVIIGLLGVISLAGCGASKTADNASDNSNATASSDSKDTNGSSDFKEDSDIGVVSREDGSGTRGAFIELFGIQEEKDGQKVDNTIDSAVVTNSTAVMMTTVAGDPTSIGYASLGSMNDTVKGVKIDGVEPTAENINAHKYTIARPFQIVTKDGLSPLGQDFIKYVLSKDGQKIITDNGYIAIDKGEDYSKGKESGKLTIGGSSSVTPVMEKLTEAYKKLYPDVDIEVQQSDSSTGVQNAIDGVCDIGMASRDLKPSETEKGVKATTIAMDGIVIIVNKANPIDNLTKDQVKDIYTGKITKWSEVK